MFFKRFLAYATAFSLSVSLIGAYASYGDEMQISAVNRSDGIVSIDIIRSTDKKTRISITSTDKKRTYNYPHVPGEGEIDIPLIFGNGHYEINLLRELEGYAYEIMDTHSLILDLADYDAVYYSSSVMVPWGSSVKTVKKADELTAGAKSNFEKFAAIYVYMTENIIYDIYKRVDIGYLSDPDVTLSDGSGICLDLAVLFAALVRAAGVKCRLVYGYVSDAAGLHSWNEVYLKGQWIIVDPTRDSQYFISQIPYRYAKSPENYESIVIF